MCYFRDACQVLPWYVMVALWLPGSASAQEPIREGVDPEAGTTDEPIIEEVVVTGSRIARRDFFAPSPLATLSRNAIETSSQPTLEEAVKRMPQATPDHGRTTNNGGLGQSRVNLRYFGSDRTLVLLNGRRLAPAGTGSSVDVNMLPQALVENVEIITGGATTVYGSDAVAGVVNFITRSDFDGFEAEVSAYVTEEGDSEVYDANVAWGHDFANGRGNIALFGGVLERKGTFAGQRGFTSVQWGDIGIGELVPLGSFIIPQGRVPDPQVDLGDGPVNLMFTSDGRPAAFVFPDDLYNFQPLNYLQVPLARKYGGLFLDYTFSERAELYLELTHSRNEAQLSLAPVPARLGVEVNLDNPLLAPETRQVFADFFPASGPNTVAFGFQRRLEELGPRIIQPTNDYSRIVTGLRGAIGASWHYDAWLTYTRGEEVALKKNDASGSRFRQGLLVDPVTGQCFDTAGGCVAINPFGAGALTREALEFISIEPYANFTDRDQTLVSAFVSGTPLRGWAGPVSLAFGAEWRSDSGSFQADAALFSGDSLGYSGDDSIDGKESVIEVYAEGLLPLAEGAEFAEYLALELGGRLSEYDHAGSVETWKLGAVWEPVVGLLFRGMFQRSVRAPNLQEAFQEQFVVGERSLGLFGLTDPCSASQDPAGNGIADRCIVQGIPADQIGLFEANLFSSFDFVQGGNPDVTSEEAESRTIGFVYTGVGDWSVSVDYFDLEIEGTIGSANPFFVCHDAGNTSGATCDRIRRDSVTFDIAAIDATTANLGTMRSRGFDVQLNYATELPTWLAVGEAGASLSLDLVWTHLLSMETQDDPAVATRECAGYFGDPCSVISAGETFPENRVLINAAYQSGRLDVSLGWRWIAGTDNALTVPRYADFAGFQGTPVITSVGAEQYVDLGVGVRINDHFRARLNIANLLDADPPMMASYVFSNNTDHGLYDVFGRSYQLTLSYRQ